MPIEGDVFAIAKALKAGSEASLDNAKIKGVAKTAVRTKLTGGRHGRVYTVLFYTDREGRVHPYGHRPPHTASAPGEAPARDSGTLLRAMAVEVERIPFGALLSIKSGAPYSHYLEFGTSKMRPRPYMRPITREITPVLRHIWAAGIEGRERAMARALGGRG
jgi:HK97 gp10 family phage protein